MSAFSSFFFSFFVKRLKALNFFFSYFICCHLSVMHRSVIFTWNLQIEQPGLKSKCHGGER